METREVVLIIGINMVMFSLLLLGLWVFYYTAYYIVTLIIGIILIVLAIVSKHYTFVKPIKKTEKKE